MIGVQLAIGLVSQRERCQGCAAAKRESRIEMSILFLHNPDGIRSLKTNGGARDRCISRKGNHLGNFSSIRTLDDLVHRPESFILVQCVSAPIEEARPAKP